jgi:hypothetical protein
MTHLSCRRNTGVPGSRSYARRVKPRRVKPRRGHWCFDFNHARSRAALDLQARPVRLQILPLLPRRSRAPELQILRDLGNPLDRYTSRSRPSDRRDEQRKRLRKTRDGWGRGRWLTWAAFSDEREVDEGEEDGGDGWGRRSWVEMVGDVANPSCLSSIFWWWRVWIERRPYLQGLELGRNDQFNSTDSQTDQFLESDSIQTNSWEPNSPLANFGIS